MRILFLFLSIFSINAKAAPTAEVLKFFGEGLSSADKVVGSDAIQDFNRVSEMAIPDKRSEIRWSDDVYVSNAFVKEKNASNHDLDMFHQIVVKKGQISNVRFEVPKVDQAPVWKIEKSGPMEAVVRRNRSASPRMSYEEKFAATKKNGEQFFRVKQHEMGDVYFAGQPKTEFRATLLSPRKLSLALLGQTKSFARVELPPNVPGDIIHFRMNFTESGPKSMTIWTYDGHSPREVELPIRQSGSEIQADWKKMAIGPLSESAFATTIARVETINPLKARVTTGAGFKAARTK
jgi:hypothetical protein